MRNHALLIALVVITSLAALVSATIIVSAEVADHPSKCYACHSYINDFTQYKTIGPHNITNASIAWNLCIQCHSTTGAANYQASNYDKDIPPAAGDYVPSSVHGSIGCKCHAVMHVSYTKPYQGWVYYYLPNVTSTTVNITKPKPTDLERNVGYINETILQNLNVSNTYTGNKTYGVYIVFFVNGSISEVNENTRYLICFNCHFLTEQPAGLGMYKIENGLLKIGIPPEALQLNPHGITEEQLRSLLGSGQETLPVETVPLAAMGINALLAASILLVMARRK